MLQGTRVHVVAGQTMVDDVISTRLFSVLLV
jgi:hypothetical protein